MHKSSLKSSSNAIPTCKTAAAATPLLIVAFAICSLAQTKSSDAVSPSNSLANITIKNFGQMNAHFYRGAQPRDDEYKALAALGIKAIIDLRDDPMPSAKAAAEAAKMRYFNIPMSDSDYPKEGAIDEFLKITKDTGNWPFYVHCAGGRHRTGLMAAVYRFNHDGWDYQRAYQEMKRYDYYSRWGHGAIKKYVQNYWQRFQSKNSSTSLLVQTNK